MQFFITLVAVAIWTAAGTFGGGFIGMTAPWWAWALIAAVMMVSVNLLHLIRVLIEGVQVIRALIEEVKRELWVIRENTRKAGSGDDDEEEDDE